MGTHRHSDEVSDTPGGGESQGGRWRGNQKAPAHPEKGVTTHVLRETEEVADNRKDADEA